ncbi:MULTISPECIES: hypothetical protein [Nocardia]|uniref:hypothetical protein n=1 Tax=Nocardia abscessus TaxID=120957 RepID=UPI001893E122|nr:hypothetical protein [Nocardia abscessus]MBF6475384.1 hypothetical protein [Nocardia abscessus]
MSSIPMVATVKYRTAPELVVLRRQSPVRMYPAAVSALGPPAVPQAIEAAWFDYPAVAEPVDQARGFEHAFDHVTYRSVWRDRLAAMVQVGDKVLLVANGVSVFEVLELDEEGYALVESVLEDSPGRTRSAFGPTRSYPSRRRRTRARPDPGHGFCSCIWLSRS